MCSFPFFPCSPDISIRSKPLPSWLSQLRFSKLIQPTGQRLSNVRTQQRKIPIWPILFLYYEESLISSNLNSNLLWFPCFRPNIHTVYVLHFRLKGCKFNVGLLVIYSVSSTHQLHYYNLSKLALKSECANLERVRRLKKFNLF